MTESEDSTNASQPQDSPYAPPPMVSELPVSTPATSVSAMPIPVALVVIYSAIATALTMFLVMSLNRVLPNEYGFLILFSPTLVLAGFVALFFLVADTNGPVAAISLAWKTAIVILVPPASMICFVPTCVGSTILLMPLIERTMDSFGIAIPIFIAYTVTCLIVAVRLRNRIVQRSQSVMPSYSEFEAGTSSALPFSVPEARKPK
jgi:hypothetical protein